MIDWTNTSWTGRRPAEPLPALRRLAAITLAALALGTALPAHAFQKTSFADGSFEYFFAAPSLDIRGPGDLDFTGLSFIEGVSDGFRVGALFDLDWLGGEQATLDSPLSSWNGLDTLPRSLSIVAEGSLTFGTTRLALAGGSISLAAGGTVTMNGGSAVDAGGGNGAIVIGDPVGAVSLTSGGGILPATALLATRSGAVSLTSGGGILLTEPSGAITVAAPHAVSPSSGGGILLIEPSGTITPAGPSPIPEPDVAALLFAGLLVLAGLRKRHANAAR